MVEETKRRLTNMRAILIATLLALPISAVAAAPAHHSVAGKGLHNAVVVRHPVTGRRMVVRRHPVTGRRMVVVRPHARMHHH